MEKDNCSYKFRFNCVKASRRFLTFDGVPVSQISFLGPWIQSNWINMISYIKYLADFTSYLWNIFQNCFEKVNRYEMYLCKLFDWFLPMYFLIVFLHLCVYICMCILYVKVRVCANPLKCLLHIKPWSA